VKLPRLVFGTVTGGKEAAVMMALQAGYRHIDTAQEHVCTSDCHAHA
jgi:diketogulonate reductase-like aldo/keto reductase